MISGGGGYDRTMYDGLVRGYATAAGGINGFTVRGGFEGGTDTISGVESIEFLDGRFSFETDSLYAVVYRMYDAAFDRGPDVFGMRTWTDELARGTPLSRLSDVFEASPEFQRRYGALTNTDFLKEMYRFSLDREADTEGLAHWVRNMDNGMTRAEVLYHFSESQEHKDVMTAKILAQGMWIQDEATFLIARMYDAALDRNPDLAGLRTWRAEMANGLTELQLAQAFMTSQEFQTRFGALNNQQYVEMLYQTALGRVGDAQGVADWTARLNSGTSRAAGGKGRRRGREHQGAARRGPPGAWPSRGRGKDRHDRLSDGNRDHRGRHRHRGPAHGGVHALDVEHHRPGV